MSDLKKKASRPVVCVDAKLSVADAVRTMVERKIGAVVVTEKGRVAGIFSERDLMQRVVLKKLDPVRTPVSKVMTTPVVSVGVDGDEDEAVAAMVERHIRHVPVVDKRKHAVGMLSFRDVMRSRVDDLKHEVQALEAYLGYDGVSG
ncbi:MAG: CBS domain-containing protein [Thermoanaerobaculia bacterium]